MTRTVRNALASAGTGLVAAIGLVAYDCQVGSHESCLMSQGAAWLYFLVVFLASWALLACFGAFFDALKSPGSRSGPSA